METIREIIKKNWSFVFALIPGVNILYLVVFILFSDRSAGFYHWAVPATLFPSAVVLHYLPEQYRPLGLYLFFLSLGLLCFFKRSELLTPPKKPDPRRLALFLALVLFFAAMLAVPLTKSRRQARETLTDALCAIAEQDQARWSELVHPRCDADIASVQNLQAQLDGITLDTGTLGDEIKITSVQKLTLFQRGSSRTAIKARLTADGARFDLSVLYLTDADGEGIRSFVIENTG